MGECGGGLVADLLEGKLTRGGSAPERAQKRQPKHHDDRTVLTATGTINPVMKKILIIVHFYRSMFA